MKQKFCASSWLITEINKKLSKQLYQTIWVVYSGEMGREVGTRSRMCHRGWVVWVHEGTLLLYRVSQEECARLREVVPYVKVYRYNPKHLCPKLNGYGDNGQRSLKI